LTVSARHDDSLMRAAFAPARSLEPTDAEVARVLARVASHARRPRPRLEIGGTRRLLAPGLAALALLVGAAYSVPPTRAALEDLADTFSSWVAGGAGAAPGRALAPGEQAPDYFHDRHFEGDARVIAHADGYKLYAILQPDGSVEFDLGNTGVGLGFDPASFDDHGLFVLGPGLMENADENGHVPLFGVTARTVTSVELSYASGPPLRVDGVEGSFVLLVEPARGPREVVAFAPGGEVVERQLVDDSDHYGPRIDWSRYGPPAPRVPAECLPGPAGPNPPKPCPR
jgi:hypothetical protein